MAKDYFENGDPSRWIVLGLFSLFSASNAIQWITYAPIAMTVKEFFHLTTNEVNMLSTVYMIVFILGVYFSSTTFEKWGVRHGLVAGSFLNALGSILKVVYALPRPGFAPLIISQIINSVAQLFVLSTPPLIAAQYFSPPQRALATNLACTANNLGNAIALLLPPLIVPKGTAKHFYLLFGMEMGLCVLIFVLIFFFLRPPRLVGIERLVPIPEEQPLARASGAPPDDVDNAPQRAHSPPKDAADERRAEDSAQTEGARPLGPTTVDPQRPPDARHALDSGHSPGPTPWGSDFVREFQQVGGTIRKLCRKGDFVLLFGAFSISMGGVWTYASVLAQILYPFGVSAELAGITAAMNVVAGIITSYFACLWVDRSRQYKYPVIICLVGSLISFLGLLILMLKVPNPSTLMNVSSAVSVIIAGIFQMTMIPICFEFAMEIAFPLQESVPGSMLMGGANLAALMMVTASSYILGEDNPTSRAAVNVVIMIVSVSAVGVVLVLPPRERLNRREAELLARQQLSLLDERDQSAYATPHHKHLLVGEKASRELRFPSS